MSKLKIQMSNQNQNPNVKKKYDLAERTARFGESIIELCLNIKRNSITSPIISQAIRCATSIGANYAEADGAESKKDFRHKIAISKKECKEMQHWLRMIAKACPDKKEICRKFWKEVHELTLIFSAILNK